jgi:hypothetical protein
LTTAGGTQPPGSFCKIQETSSNVASNKGLGRIERQNRNSAVRQLSGADAAFLLRKSRLEL